MTPKISPLIASFYLFNNEIFCFLFFLLSSKCFIDKSSHIIFIGISILECVAIRENSFLVQRVFETAKNEKEHLPESILAVIPFRICFLLVLCAVVFVDSCENLSID